MSLSVSLVANAFMLSFKPSGGSITIFKDLYKIPRGKAFVGLVVSHNLKFGWIFTIFGKFSNNFSSYGNQSGNKSQFCNIAQLPRYAKLTINSSASLSIFYPKEIALNLLPEKPSLSANSHIS